MGAAKSFVLAQSNHVLGMSTSSTDSQAFGLSRLLYQTYSSRFKLMRAEQCHNEWFLWVPSNTLGEYL